MSNKNEEKKGRDEMMDVEIKERYVNPYTDFGFKKLFGTELNKDLLISFLNALFHDKPDITDLTYLNSERLGEGRYDRKAVFDVYCRLADNTHIIVEMQKSEYPGDSFIHEIKLKDVEDNHVFYDKLTYVYLEMPKFKKREDELVTMFDKWMYALTNLARLLERPKALQERVFTRLFEQAEVARFTPDERVEYMTSKKDYWDYYSSLETSYDKGLAEGRAAERLSNARSLKENGVPVDLIAKSLGLTADELQQL